MPKARLDWHTLVRAMRYAIERKRTEHQRVVALARAEAAVRARDNILGIVSHDLRGPLHAISLGTLLLWKPALSQEQKIRQLQSIRRSTEQMNRLIQDLLDVAKIEAGHLSIRHDSLDPATLAHEAIDSHRLAGEQKQLTFEFAEPVTALPPVSADRDRVLQVFSNLLGNAIKFTQPGFTLPVAAQP